MKKLTKIVLLVVVLVMSLVLATACETLKNHEHKFSSEWSTDGTNHYHACTFEGCTEKSGLTACSGGYATCQAKATCLVCGNQYGELGEHKYNLGYATEEFLATPATCTEKATYYKSCACGLKGTETFAAGEMLEHTWEEVFNEELRASEATCTAPARYFKSCQCGAVSDKETFASGEALGHSYSDVVTDPTCTEAGYTTHTCGTCGDTYQDSEVPATGHKFVDSKCACGAEYVVQAEWILTTTLKDGDQVLIGAPAYGKLLSAEKVNATSYYNKGVDYSATNFANVTDAEIFVVTVNEDGTYTFTSLTGKVIALAASYSSLNETGENKSWALTDREDGTFLVKNTGRNTYLEWYASKNNWSTYTAGNTKEYYLSFYVKNADYSDVHVHNHISAVTDPTCTEAGYTTYTCACEDTYTVEGAPATGHSFAEGTCSACGATDPDYVAPVSGGSADFDTIQSTGDSGYTKTYTTTNGWTTVNSAIQVGGATVLNPAYPVVGPDNTHKAVCLNGKVSAPGKVTSPTLTGGISKLTLKYTKIFTDTNLSVTITVTDLATGTKYTHTISVELDKNEKYVVYEDVWTLDVAITGEFTIEIVNNSPSANTGNKDRFTILDLIWE